jgi:ribosome biogenesis GTPase A
MEPYWDVIKKIIQESDLVLEILDARLVELSRNKRVEELIDEIGRPMIFVINKSDLVSKESIKKQVKKLKEKAPVVFISVKNKSSVKILLYLIKKVFKKHGKKQPFVKDPFAKKTKHKQAIGDVIVGVLGYPNVGKSSIINALAHKKKVQVSKKSGTTRGIHWIKASNEIKLLDSPGVIPLQEDDEIRYGLIGAKDTERLRNLELVSHAIIKLFLKNNKQAFEKFYKIELNNKNPEKIVEEIAEKKGHLLKGGKIDENRTCSMIIRDWQQGRLRL